MDRIKKQFLQWHNNVEKKTPCHFCGGKLSDKIFSCDSGHDCCFSCKTESCIACPKSSLFFRNHSAEFFILQFNNLANYAKSLNISAIEIKSVENSPKENKTTETIVDRIDKVCMVTEKEFKKSDNPINLTNSSENKLLKNEKNVDQLKSGDNSLNPWGFFPCWVKAGCSFKGHVYPHMLDHIKRNHFQALTVDLFKGWPHVIKWDLNYCGINRREDRAFEIQSVGLFVLHTFITNDGDLKAHVLMYESSKRTIKYRYELHIECDNYEASFSTLVDSCRLPRQSLYDQDKGFLIPNDSLLHKAIKLKTAYKCTVQIKKLNETPFNKRHTKSQGNFGIRHKGQDNNDLKNHHQISKSLNRQQFKPTRKNINNFKNKSIISGFLDPKTTTQSLTHVPSTSNHSSSGLEIKPLLTQPLSNAQKEMHCQQKPQIQQNPSVVNSNSSNAQLSFHPHKQIIKNKQTYQRITPQNHIIHQQPNDMSSKVSTDVLVKDPSVGNCQIEEINSDSLGKGLSQMKSNDLELINASLTQVQSASNRSSNMSQAQLMQALIDAMRTNLQKVHSQQNLQVSQRPSIEVNKSSINMQPSSSQSRPQVIKGEQINQQIMPQNVITDQQSSEINNQASAVSTQPSVSLIDTSLIAALCISDDSNKPEDSIVANCQIPQVNPTQNGEINLESTSVENGDDLSQTKSDECLIS